MPERCGTGSSAFDEPQIADVVSIATPLTVEARRAVARRGTWLSRITLLYNVAEGILAVGAGAVAGSIALIGFGTDSLVEVASSIAALFRLRRDANPMQREHAEQIAHRVVGWSFLALALYVTVEAAHSLLAREAPTTSTLGLVVTCLSVVVMPLLARAKRRVAVALGSRALTADAKQTSLCAYLSAIVLAGLALNAAFGWWWADPVAALGMVPIIAREGLEGVRGEAVCDDCY